MLLHEVDYFMIAEFNEFRFPDMKNPANLFLLSSKDADSPDFIVVNIVLYGTRSKIHPNTPASFRIQYPSPISQLLNTPYKMTGPAIVKILTPIPKT